MIWPRWIDFFSRHTTGVRFFPSIIRHETYFSGIFFAKFFLSRIFSPQNQSAGYIYIYIYKITHTPAQKSNGRPLNRSQTVPNVSVRRAEYNLSIIVGHGWGTPLPRFLRRIVMSLKGQGCRSSRLGVLLDPL